MISALIVAAIFISVALGYKTKINTGFFAIAFAYLLGCFALNMGTGAVIGKWPISTFFVIFAVSLFYNFALVNGTLEKLALHLLYACRKFPKLLPYVLYFVAASIAALGAGYFTVMAFLVPITLLLCDKMGMDKLIGAAAVNCGALSGANFMVSGSGVIFRGLMTDSGYADDTAFGYSATIFITSVIFSLVFITIFLILTGANKKVQGHLSIEKPEAFEPKQKQNLFLIIAMVVIVLAAPIAKMLLPGNAVIAMINSKMDVGLVAIVMSVIALMLKLADEKSVIAKVPWNTLIMICGVGMLIGVAIEAGTVTLMSEWIGTNLPSSIVPVALSIVGGFMSFFSSTLGVVAPALFPLIPELAEATNLGPQVLFTCIVIGAQASAISPFSSGGSLALGSCSNEEERTALFPRLLFVAVPVSMITATAFSFILSFIIR